MEIQFKMIKVCKRCLRASIVDNLNSIVKEWDLEHLRNYYQGNDLVGCIFCLSIDRLTDNPPCYCGNQRPTRLFKSLLYTRLSWSTDADITDELAAVQAANARRYPRRFRKTKAKYPHLPFSMPDQWAVIDPDGYLINSGQWDRA